MSLAYEGSAALAGHTAAQRFAARLARGARSYAGGQHPQAQAVARALQGVVRRGIVRKSGRGEYALPKPMFAHCVRRRVGPGRADVRRRRLPMAVRPGIGTATADEHAFLHANGVLSASEAGIA